MPYSSHNVSHAETVWASARQIRRNVLALDEQYGDERYVARFAA